MSKIVMNSPSQKLKPESKLKEGSKSIRKSENKTSFEDIRRKYQEKTDNISNITEYSDDNHRKEVDKTTLPSVVNSLGAIGKVERKSNFHKNSEIFRICESTKEIESPGKRKFSCFIEDQQSESPIFRQKIPKTEEKLSKSQARFGMVPCKGVPADQSADQF